MMNRCRGWLSRYTAVRNRMFCCSAEHERVLGAAEFAAFSACCVASWQQLWRCSDTPRRRSGVVCQPMTAERPLGRLRRAGQLAAVPQAPTIRSDHELRVPALGAARSWTRSCQVPAAARPLNVGIAMLLMTMLTAEPP